VITRQKAALFVTHFCDGPVFKKILPLFRQNTKTMETGKRKYTKQNVKTQFVKKADGSQSIRFEIYLDGKRKYERLENLLILPETDAATCRQNAATLKQVEKLRKQRQKEIDAQLAQEDPIEDSKLLMLSDWVEKFAEIQKARGVRTFKDFEKACRFLQGFGRDLPLNAVDKNYCLDFIDYLRCDYIQRNGELLSPKTCANTLGYLNTAFNEAVREGKMTRNPMSLLSAGEKFKLLEHKREYLTLQEVQMLIDTPCPECPVLKQAYLFACYCGIRLGDIIALTWDRIYLEDGRWVVATRMFKTQRMVYVPLPKQALQWLPPRKNPEDRVFEGMSRNKCDLYMKAWVNEAGITYKTVTFHTSRHTYATMLLTVGTDIYTASKLLGHTSVRHTQRYARIINKKKNEAIAQLDNL
jgi:integrase